MKPRRYTGGDRKVYCQVCETTRKHNRKGECIYCNTNKNKVLK